MTLTWFKAIALSLILTGLIELGAALCMKKRGTALVIVLLVNTLTNPPAELVSLIVARFRPDLFRIWILAAEASVVVIEALIYRRRRDLFAHPWRFSLLLNMLSFSLGSILNAMSGG